MIYDLDTHDIQRSHHCRGHMSATSVARMMSPQIPQFKQHLHHKSGSNTIYTVNHLVHVLQWLTVRVLATVKNSALYIRNIRRFYNYV
jgi:hypothetical protein